MFRFFAVSFVGSEKTKPAIANPKTPIIFVDENSEEANAYSFVGNHLLMIKF